MREQRVGLGSDVFLKANDPAFVLEIGADGRASFHNVNAAFEQFTGLKASGLRGKSPDEVLPAGLIRPVEAYRSCLESAAPLILEQRLTFPWDKISLITSFFPFTGEEGGATIVAGLFHVKAGLAEPVGDEIAGSPSENREGHYRALITQFPDVILLEEEGRVILANATLTEVTGFLPEEIQGRPLMSLVHPEEISFLQGALARLLRGERIAPLELRMLTKNQGSKVCEVRAGLIRLPNRILVFVILSDATHRIRAEMALAAEKEQLVVTLRGIADGVITCDREGRILLMNRASERLTGWTREEGFQEFIPNILKIGPENRDSGPEHPVLRVLSQKIFSETGENHFLERRDGSICRIQMTVSPLKDTMGNFMGAVTVFRDITEREILEKERQRNQKLESVGLLAGGIAHDFNNFLTAILGNLSLVRMSSHSPQDIQTYIHEAERATFRARDLTLQLLTFARGGAPIKEQASVKEIVEESARFCLRGSRCEFRTDFEADLLGIEADRGQISQVIQNLIINADQAMPEGGTIRIRGGNAHFERPYRHLKPGAYVRISVQDQGTGIRETDLPKIFDPYFTTKPKGNGLGLSVVYSIVKHHDGHVEVSSEWGKGTTFTLYLPASPREAPPPIDDGSLGDRLIHGRGRILVMDDEEMIRTMAKNILKYLGYEVLLASAGQEALEIYQKHREEGVSIDGFIMDLTIPGAMGGLETLSELLKMDPSAKVFVSSGYSQDPIMAQYKDYGFVGRISKPYKPSEMSEALGAILNPEKEDPPRP